MIMILAGTALLLPSCDGVQDVFQGGLTQEEVRSTRTSGGNGDVRTPKAGEVLDRTSPKDDVFRPGSEQTLDPSSAPAIPRFENDGENESLVILDQNSLTPLLTKTNFGLDLFDALGGQAAYNRLVSSYNNGTFNGASIERAIRNYIKANPNDFAFRETSLRRNSNASYIDNKVALMSFNYVFSGRQIRGAYISFRFIDGKLVEVLSRDFGVEAANPNFEPLSEGFDQDLELPAIAALKDNFAKVVEGSAQPMIFPRAVTINGRSGYDFIEAVRFEATTTDNEPYQFFYDAEGNEILEWRSLHMQITGKAEALVVPRTPSENRTQRVALPFVSVTSGSNSVSANSAGNFNLPGNQATIRLSSPFFAITNSAGENASITSSNDFLFGSNEATSAEVTTFHHLNVVRSWAKEVINPRWFSTQVGANVNIDNSCNAFWNGRTVNFFSESANCNNTGAIADVIYHEWGHGLDTNTGGIQDGAYSEGIGDIVAMLITGSGRIAPGFRKGRTGGFIRNLERDSKFPPTNTAVHIEGQIIGSTYFDLMNNFIGRYGKTEGTDKVKKLFLKSLLTTSQYTDAYHALITLDAAEGNGFRGPNFCLITEAFERHGLARADRNCTAGIVEPETAATGTPLPSGEQSDSSRYAVTWDVDTFKSSLKVTGGTVGTARILLTNVGSEALSDCRMQVRVSQFNDDKTKFEQKNTFVKILASQEFATGKTIDGQITITMVSADLSKQRAGLAISCDGQSVTVKPE